MWHKGSDGTILNLIFWKKKKVIVGMRLDSSQTRFSPTLTLYYTSILECCIIQLKNGGPVTGVLRCRARSTLCRSPGHGIGRPGLMVTCHTTDRISRMGEGFSMPHNRSRSNFRFWKRKWRNPRWWMKAEIAPAHVMMRKNLFTTTQYMMKSIRNHFCDILILLKSNHYRKAEIFFTTYQLLFRCWTNLGRFRDTVWINFPSLRFRNLGLALWSCVHWARLIKGGLDYRLVIHLGWISVGVKQLASKLYITRWQNPYIISSIELYLNTCLFDAIVGRVGLVLLNVFL